MLNIRNIFIGFLVSAVALLNSNVAMCDVPQYVAAWGNGKLVKCGGDQLGATNACIGQSVGACGSYSLASPGRSDIFVVLAMVATEIRQNGARFCPVQVEGRNKNKSNAWTEYILAANGTESCVWLCKPGFYGENCEKTVSGTSGIACDATLFMRDNYASITASDGSNIEYQLPMFSREQYDACGLNRKQEHDMILMIVDWTLSGHGAYAQQMVVRAERRGWDYMESTATVYPANGSSRILLCKNGYRANAAGSDCEPIDRTNCAESDADKLANLCSGWPASKYNATNYDFKLVGNCYQYRCSSSGYALNSSFDCAACASNMRGGVNPVNGQCVKCDSGMIFSESAASSAYCVAAMSLSKTDMQYGRGRTKNSVADFTKQCWVKTDNTEYLQCVIGQ